MNTLIKIALGAALAGALMAVFGKRGPAASLPERSSADGMRRVPATSQIPTLTEVADEHAVWGGGGSGMNS